MKIKHFEAVLAEARESSGRKLGRTKNGFSSLNKVGAAALRLPPSPH